MTATLPAASNQRSLVDFIEEDVFPRLSADLVYTDPAHRFQKSPHKWRGGCPWHESKSGSSFTVDPQTLRWHCAGCHIGGHVLQYLYRLEGRDGSPRGEDFTRLARHVCELAGVAFPDRDLTPEERERIQRAETRRDILAAVIAHSQACLWADTGDAARAYLHNARGLSDDDIRELGLGLYDSANTIRAMLEARVFERPDIEASQTVWPKLEGYILFPWSDDYGRPLTLYGRWPGDPPSRLPKTIALGGEGTKRSPLYFDRARNAGHHDLILVEGVLDAAIAQARGDTRVVACVAAQLSRLQVATLVRHRVRSVTICLDPDSAGENGIMSCVSSLDAAGVVPYVAPTLPEGMDPDELIVRHGLEAFQAHVSQAVHGYRYAAERIIRDHCDDTDAGRVAALAAARRFAQRVGVVGDVLRVFFWPVIEAGTGVRSGAFHGHSDQEPPDTDDVAETAETPAAFPLTDTGNAERLVSRYGRDIRYNWGRGVWHVWSGKHWEEDRAGRMEQLAKATARAIPDEARGLEGEAYTKVLKWAVTSENVAKREAMVRAARSEDGIPVQPHDLDSDPWLLNVANGTLNLRTGTLEQHRRDNLITRLIDVPYLPDATCPKFLAFLERIFGGDRELIAYVQRLLGYSLTGSIREQIMVIAWGTGSNGKSTLLGIFRRLLGDYAREADADSFMEKRGEAIREDIAALDGARFVAASETADGKRLSEALVKKMTGGEHLRARRLYENGYEFQPQFKVWLSTNHRPEIRGTEYAIWRRIRLIPFNVTITDDEKDPDLPGKLLEELPGILAWAVRGCMDWQRTGLVEPEAVRKATAEYQRDMDILAGWIDDRCELFPGRKGIRTAAKDLYADYVAYCEAVGDEPIKQRTFGRSLSDRGCGDEKSNGIRYRTGIRLKGDPPGGEQTTFDDAAADDAGRVVRVARDAKSGNFYSQNDLRDFPGKNDPYDPYDPEFDEGEL